MTEVAAPALTVRVESFEGPLDLLLHLCRTSELDLARLPIRTVTDQYLAHPCDEDTDPQQDEDGLSNTPRRSFVPMFLLARLSREQIAVRPECEDQRKGINCQEKQ